MTIFRALRVHFFTVNLVRYYPEAGGVLKRMAINLHLLILDVAVLK